jgi:hypothetical protein
MAASLYLAWTAPLEERVNVLKRNALCDYIIARHGELGFSSHADLYDFFLLDPDMGGCFQTSRVVCATGSLQVYVQRCMQALEQTGSNRHHGVPAVQVEPGRIPAGEWDWRKNFRVWQANRTVFLYPESYIDPALLDTKTPLFEALENNLMQQSITMDSATEAYETYLSSPGATTAPRRTPTTSSAAPNKNRRPTTGAPGIGLRGRLGSR